MRAPDVLRDVYLRVATLLIAALVATIAAFVYIFLGSSDHLIVLYGSGAGDPRFLGSVRDVWGILGVAVFIATVNLWLANAFYHRVRSLSYLVGYATLFFAVLLFVAVAAIISTN